MRRPIATPPPAPESAGPPADRVADVTWRSAARLVGTIRAMRIQPWAGVATLELDVFDDTGGVVVVFTGRRHVPGIALGRRIEVVGRVGARRGALAMLNPRYRLLPPPPH